MGRKKKEDPLDFLLGYLVLGAIAIGLIIAVIYGIFYLLVFIISEIVFFIRTNWVFVFSAAVISLIFYSSFKIPILRNWIKGKFQTFFIWFPSYFWSLNYKKQFVKNKFTKAYKGKISDLILYSEPSKKNDLKIKDETIIDVNENFFDQSIEKEIDPNIRFKEVPFWPYLFINSFKDLRQASDCQKDFYFYYRDNFKKEIIIDIDGNTNYGFILFYELLNWYESHQNVELLEKHFILLEKSCPETKPVFLPTLVRIFKERGDSFSKARLEKYRESLQLYEQGYMDFFPSENLLGTLYKERLNLEEKETIWLNKFPNPSINLKEIRDVTIILFLKVLKGLEKKFEFEQSSLEQEISELLEKIREYNDENFHHSSDQIDESAIFLTIFKRCENAVREFFNIMRKVQSEFSISSKKINNEFEYRIGSLVDEKISESIESFKKPSYSTQVKLNAYYIDRWRVEFSELKSTFNEIGLDGFAKGISNLEELNLLNRSIEKIFYMASKFIGKYNKELSLKYYATYVYYNLKTNYYIKQELPKNSKILLFSDEKEFEVFNEIIRFLVKDMDIKRAILRISNFFYFEESKILSIRKEKKRKVKPIPSIYSIKKSIKPQDTPIFIDSFQKEVDEKTPENKPKIKRITLDKEEIERVRIKQDATAEILNQYLNTSDENILDSEYSGVGTEPDSIKQKNKEDYLSSKPMTPEFTLDDFEKKVISMIAEGSYCLSQTVVESFALEFGLFRNQIVDRINEKCSPILEGEVLIEEDDKGNYVMEELYYKIVSTAFFDLITFGVSETKIDAQESNTISKGFKEPDPITSLRKKYYSIENEKPKKNSHIPENFATSEVFQKDNIIIEALHKGEISPNSEIKGTWGKFTFLGKILPNGDIVIFEKKGSTVFQNLNEAAYFVTQNKIMDGYSFWKIKHENFNNWVRIATYLRSFIN